MTKRSRTFADPVHNTLVKRLTVSMGAVLKARASNPSVSVDDTQDFVHETTVMIRQVMELLCEYEALTPEEKLPPEGVFLDE